MSINLTREAGVLVWIDWFWRFIGYSFLGWLMETTIFTVEQRHWVNRGFLNGPLCPIYGSGAVLILLALNPLSASWPLLLITGILLTTILEYLTSWVLEKLFHARWWDYSSMPLNLHGRITLFHSLFWGALCLILVYGLNPVYSNLLAIVPLQVRLTAGAVVFVLLLLDIGITVAGMIDLNRQLARLQEMTQMIRQKNSELSENLQKRVTFLAQSFLEMRQQDRKISLVQRRLLLAFPNLRSLHYQDALKKLRRWAKSKKPRQIWPTADLVLLRNQIPLLRRRRPKPPKGSAP